MKMNYYVLLSAFVIGLLEGLLPFLFARFPYVSLEPSTFLCFSALESWVLLIINPVLLFVLLYSQGRRMDLGKSFGAVAFSLFIGGLLGSSTGYFSGPYILGNGWEASFPDISSFLATVFSLIHRGLSSGLSTLFPGFTAMAIAYFRKQSKTAQAP